jgi:hypothetical protein
MQLKQKDEFKQVVQSAGQAFLTKIFKKRRNLLHKQSFYRLRLL